MAQAGGVLDRNRNEYVDNYMGIVDGRMRLRLGKGSTCYLTSAKTINFTPFKRIRMRYKTIPYGGNSGYQFMGYISSRTPEGFYGGFSKNDSYGDGGYEHTLECDVSTVKSSQVFLELYFSVGSAANYNYVDIISIEFLTS